MRKSPQSSELMEELDESVFVLCDREMNVKTKRKVFRQW